LVVNNLTSAVNIPHRVSTNDDRKIGDEYPANREFTRSVVPKLHQSLQTRHATKPAAETLQSEQTKSARNVKRYPVINVSKTNDVHQLSTCAINTFWLREINLT